MIVRRVLLMAVRVVAVVSLVAVAGAGPRASQDPVTLTGCLRSGGAEGVFILRGAAAPVAAGQMARDYLLVQVPDDVSLPPLVNHRVAVTGTVHTPDNAPAPPDGANSAERALRRIAVRGASDVASSCG